MKLVFFVALWAFVLACVLACDPDGNNEPVCTKNNLNIKTRNFWDPTRYWLCKSAGAKAESVPCDNGGAFDSAVGDCISWDQWAWSPPCPDVRP